MPFTQIVSFKIISEIPAKFITKKLSSSVIFNYTARFAEE